MKVGSQRGRRQGGFMNTLDRVRRCSEWTQGSRAVEVEPWPESRRRSARYADVREGGALQRVDWG